MTGRYGPQTVEIEALLDRVRTLTDDEAQALLRVRTADAWDAAWDAWVAARTAARAAWRAGALDAAWDAWVAARVAAWFAVRHAWVDGWVAVRDAVRALVVRDLIGHYGFTQEHFDTLVGPWESVTGTEWTREATDNEHVEVCDAD